MELQVNKRGVMRWCGEARKLNVDEAPLLNKTRLSDGCSTQCEYPINLFVRPRCPKSNHCLRKKKFKFFMQLAALQHESAR
jgi:hypothetical protein